MHRNDLETVRPKVIAQKLFLRHVVHMDVGTGDMIRAGRVLHIKNAGLVNRPRPSQVVGGGEPDVFSSMMGEVEVLLAKRFVDPLRHADERGAVDVISEPPFQARHSVSCQN